MRIRGGSRRGDGVLITYLLRVGDSGVGATALPPLSMTGLTGRRFFTVDAVGMYSSFVGRRWSAESVAFREGE